MRLDRLTLLLMIAVESARLISARPFIVDALVVLSCARMYAALQLGCLAALVRTVDVPRV